MRGDPEAEALVRQVYPVGGVLTMNHFDGSVERRLILGYDETAVITVELGVFEWAWIKLVWWLFRRTWIFDGPETWTTAEGIGRRPIPQCKLAEQSNDWRLPC